MAKEGVWRTNRFQKTVLNNGLRVVTCKIPHARSVATSVVVGIGSRHDEQVGISHFIEHLVFKGTKRRPTPSDISVPIEGMGGILNGTADKEITIFWCKLPFPHVAEGIDVLFDMLRNSLLRPEDIENERKVVVAELNDINDEPNRKALTYEMLWPDQPISRDIVGTKETIAVITRDMLLKHLNRYYAPSNIVISVAGNVIHDEIVRLVEANSRGWPCGQSPAWKPIMDVHVGPKFHLEYRATAQAHLTIALPAVAVGHPERCAVDILNVILGGGVNSRLFVEVIEKRGLAHNVQSIVDYFRDCGALFIDASVVPKYAYDATQAILAQVYHLKDGVSEEEVEKAKILSAGRLFLHLDDTLTISRWMGVQYLLEGHILDIDETMERINRVATPAEICKVATDLLVKEHLNLLITGPHQAEQRFLKLLRP